MKHSVFCSNSYLSFHWTEAPLSCIYILKVHGPIVLHWIVQIFFLPATHLGWQCTSSCSSQFCSKRSNCSPCFPKKNLMKPSAHSSVYSKNILHSLCSLLQFTVWLASQGYNLCKKQSKKQKKNPENILFIFTLKYFSVCIYHMQISHYWQHFWQYSYFEKRQ